jgi:acyl dehydratase
VGLSTYSNEACATTGQNTLNLTVTKSGTGSGTVVSSPSGINCGSDCSEAFPSGRVVTLSATPSAGSRFDGWSGGGCSGTGACTLSGNANATVTARLSAIGGPLAFTVGTALVTPNPVAPGGTVRVEVAVTASAAASAILVDLELYDAGGRKVAQSVRTGQSFAAGQARTFSWTIGPVTLAAGMYRVKVGLFSADWGTLYTWANQAGTVSVGSGPPPPATLAFTVGNAIVTPDPVSVGQTVRIDVPVTAGAAATGILVDLELYNAAGTKVAQGVVGGQSFTAGQTRTYPWAIGPVNLSAGRYTVKVGIFDADWSPLYAWDNDVGTLTVR